MATDEDSVDAPLAGNKPAAIPDASAIAQLDDKPVASAISNKLGENEVLAGVRQLNEALPAVATPRWGPPGRADLEKTAKALFSVSPVDFTRSSVDVSVVE